MKRYTKQMLTAVLLVAYAVLFNIYGRYAAPLFLNKLFNFVRTFAYMGLFAVWGVSVSRRVMQPEARRLLIGISSLMVFWLSVREFKFRFVLNPVVLRLLWYCYYIPILMIPTLVLLVTMTLHRSERWRLPGWTWLLYLPPLMLIVLVLTNDVHQWVFVFPQDTVWSEREYAYGPVIYLTMGWDLLCSGAALFLMFMKCRVPKSKKRIWLPAVLAGLFTGQMMERLADRIREQETLRLKTQIHNDIGTSLIAISELMSRGTTEKVDIQLGILENAVSYLVGNAASQNDSLDELQRQAAQVKVQLNLQGGFPQNEPARTVTMAAVRECITNCVKHAQGNRVEVHIDEREDVFDVMITNNGRPPQVPVTEGGGLSNLRRRVATIGGQMHIMCVPRFALYLTLPKKETE